MPETQNIKTKDKVFLVADYFVRKNEEDKKGLNALKLQKLLYYAQAWNLVLNKEKLFEDDFQAWIHGPAIPRVWGLFREFDFSKSHPEVLKKDFSDISASEKGIIDEVWSIYGKYPGNYLEILTHTEEPWLEARSGLSDGDASRNVISIDTMKRFYGQRLAKEEAGSN